jgi:hypothetical protein
MILCLQQQRSRHTDTESCKSNPEHVLLRCIRSRCRRLGNRRSSRSNHIPHYMTISDSLHSDPRVRQNRRQFFVHPHIDHSLECECAIGVVVNACIALLRVMGLKPSTCGHRHMESLVEMSTGMDYPHAASPNNELPYSDRQAINGKLIELAFLSSTTKSHLSGGCRVGRIIILGSASPTSTQVCST